MSDYLDNAVEADWIKPTPYPASSGAGTSGLGSFRSRHSSTGAGLRTNVLIKTITESH